MTYEKTVLRGKLGLESPDLEIAIHKSSNGILIVNYPGKDGTIEGFNDKYTKMGDLMQEMGGSVVRTSNPFCSEETYPAAAVDRLRHVLNYSLEHALRITRSNTPQVYLMGTSAGAGAVAAIASEYPQVHRILLVAPSTLVGEGIIQKGLWRFFGDVYIAIGDKDEVVGNKAGELFFNSSTRAGKCKLEVIPDCDHHFTGEVNGRILSNAPQWAFGAVERGNFPSPEGGIKLYD